MEANKEANKVDASPVFVVLSFEGPDLYCQAGGLGSRVTELTASLAGMGFETHLFFVGDPRLSGHAVSQGGRLQLHRWCQWISQHHPGGVYDGEEAKLADWERSLPGWLETNLLAPLVNEGRDVVVLAEEWHTAGTIISLKEVLLRRGWTYQVQLFWNANNTFSFHRVDWGRLQQAATITTVSRYMKHVMWGLGVDARVIPNGIGERWLEAPEAESGPRLSDLVQDRMTLVKVARWDPDKRWNMAVDAVGEIKKLGMRPLFLVKGGVEDHKREVMARSREQGLQVARVSWQGPAVESLIGAILPALDADVVDLEGYLSQCQRKLLYRWANAVLANSGVEPYGLVGLEAMATGGLAFVGCTGEDYVTPGYDAVSIQSSNPREIVHHATHLRNSPEEDQEMRRAARRTAQRYTWSAVIRRNLLPLLAESGVIVGLPEEDTPPALPTPRANLPEPSAAPGEDAEVEAIERSSTTREVAGLTALS